MDEKIQKKVLPLIELVTRRVVQVRGRMASRGFGERGANQFLPCFFYSNLWADLAELYICTTYIQIGR